MLPVAKIGLGIGVVLLGLVLFVVPVVGWTLLAIGVILLLVGIGQQRQPEWKIRGLIHEAAHHPEKADAAVQQALAIDAGNPEALAAAAQQAFANEDWQQATTYYEQYLAKAPSDWHAEAHLGASYLNAGNPDQAIPHLQKVRALPVLPDASKVTVTNALAAAFLRKNDGEQALEILKTLPLQRHTLDQPLEQALYLRALSHYQKGERSQAIGDLDRLYALDPNYPNIQQVKDEVTAGTFSIEAVQVSTDNV